MKNTFLMQWNLNGFYNNLKKLQLLVQLKSPSTISLQESRLLPKHNPRYKNYTLYQSPFGWLSSLWRSRYTSPKWLCLFSTTLKYKSTSTCYGRNKSAKNFPNANYYMQRVHPTEFWANIRRYIRIKEATIRFVYISRRSKCTQPLVGM